MKLKEERTYPEPSELNAESKAEKRKKKEKKWENSMKKSPSILSVIFTTEKKAFDDWVLGLKPREGLRERTWARPLLCVWVGVKPRVGADVDGSIFCFQFYGGEEINTCIGNNLFYGTTRFNHRKGHEMNGLHTRPPIWRVIFYLLYIHPKLRQREDYSK